jgi:hypothetical protein
MSFRQIGLVHTVAGIWLFWNYIILCIYLGRNPNALLAFLYLTQFSRILRYIFLGAPTVVVPFVNLTHRPSLAAHSK